jgi:outer membrane protein W
MKNRISIALVTLLFSLLFFNSCKAQFSAGLQLAVPLGSFTDVAKTGFGVHGSYEASFKESVNWTASLGYVTFAGQPFLGGEFGNTSMVPIQVGLKYYFTGSNNGFYGAVGMGISFISYSIAYPNSGNGNGVSFASGSTNRFALTPQLGYRMNAFDFAARYNLLSDFNYFAITASYHFKTK